MILNLAGSSLERSIHSVCVCVCVLIQLVPRLLASSARVPPGIESWATLTQSHLCEKRIEFGSRLFNDHAHDDDDNVLPRSPPEEPVNFLRFQHRVWSAAEADKQQPESLEAV